MDVTGTKTSMASLVKGRAKKNNTTFTGHESCGREVILLRGRKNGRHIVRERSKKQSGKRNRV